MKPPKCTDQHALTIIELLVVIGILAILAALIFPAIRGMNDRMNAATCMANLRTFGAAVLAYRAEHDGYLPPGHLIDRVETGKPNPWDNNEVKKELTDGGYLEKGNLPYCPSIRMNKDGIKSLKRGETAKGLFKERGSYVLNVFLLQTKIEGLPGPNWGGYPYPGDSKMLLAAESYFTGVSNSTDHQKFVLRDGPDWGGVYYEPRDHGNNKLNFMFLDGHIALIAPKVTADKEFVYSGDPNDPEIPFESWGRNGKYIQQRPAYKPKE